MTLDLCERGYCCLVLDLTRFELFFLMLVVVGRVGGGGGNEFHIFKFRPRMLCSGVTDTVSGVTDTVRD